MHTGKTDWKNKLRSAAERGELIVGAGAGTGLSAKCAEEGGADLIIIYNSGRFRMAGRGSLAGLMPYGDANAIVAITVWDEPPDGAVIASHVAEFRPMVADISSGPPAFEEYDILVDL